MANQSHNDHSEEHETTRQPQPKKTPSGAQVASRDWRPSIDIPPAGKETEESTPKDPLKG